MTRGRLAGVFAALVAAAAVGVLLASRGPGSPVAAAATKTSQTSAHLSFSLSLESPKLAGGKTLRVSGNGAVDGTSADVTVNLGSLASAVNAPVNLPSSIHAILLRQSGDEIVFVHATPMPSFTAGKGWVELDLSKLASSHGIDLGSLAAGGAAETPAHLLDLLRGAGATVTDLGPATVAGASTTHYRLLVDPAVVAKVAGLPSAITGRLGKHAAQQVPVNVWIGTDGLVHRVALAIHRGAGAASFTATLSDYGANVSIAPPPSSDVLDVTSFLTGLGGIRPQS
jgi:hypothetical protein